MNMMTAVAAVPVVALAPSSAAADPIDRSAWQTALREYERVKAAHQVVSGEHGVANAAYEAECGEPDPAFQTYRVGRSSKAEPLNRSADIRRVGNEIELHDYAGRTDLSADDFAAIARKAALLVDQYDEYLQRREAIEARVIGDINERWEAALDKLVTAQNKLLDTPAPDTEAMLYKLEVLSADMLQSEADFHEDVVTLREDARRLFAS